MNFPKFARYSKVMSSVNRFFLKEKIISFPVDPFLVIKNNNWGLTTYSELTELHGVSISSIIDAFQSEDGYTIFDGTNYTIAYNDTIQNYGRIRFTLMHEIGHIYLNHLVEFQETILSRSQLTEKKYKVLENEVNSFARNVLAPAIIVNQLNLNSQKALIDHFHISYSAASVRLRALPQDFQNLLSPLIRFQKNQFEEFINKCKSSKKCTTCKHFFLNVGAVYCPICGDKNLLNIKGVDEMIYKAYFLDDASRAVICPRCQNESLNHEGNICGVCGTHIVNMCADTQRGNSGWSNISDSCGKLLDGNSRYCTNCGNESTFYQQDLLTDWEVEYEEKQNEVHYKEIEDGNTPANLNNRRFL
ncbi:ImmA/IrrE family metallo-endopeptidase [Peribacillus simplex]|uniref:ImmA/IrrE family metallo-endopeptidase n=1 Tax=Peribacillus simplex TaxID=1478 RepID=UPI0011A2C461|nr:ImmA/IrrE family metallo-endopeptidase [Peribacillus simplex]